MERDRAAIELQTRREYVATVIQASLQPAKHLLEEGSLADFDEAVSEEAQNFEIFEHQLDAWGALWDARHSGTNKALLHLATGLGKTSVAVFDVIKFQEEYRAKNEGSPRILFACHQTEILEQASQRFATFIPEATQGFYNGTERVRDADITFATLQSLHATLDEFRPDEFDYIIYDEAHHSKADTFEKVVKHFEPEFQLALTATPDRLDEENIRELFGNELYSKGLAQALAEGLLAEPDYHIVFDDAVKEAMESGFELNTLKALSELFDVGPRNEVIVRNIKEEMARLGLEFGGVKTIVFCQNIQHAEEIAQLLDGASYHSDRPKAERKHILDDFRHGNLQVICTRDMFNEGVDIPDARLLVFLRSTSSQTIFEQQLGRGLRKKAGKERVSVLDFVANVERISMIRDLAGEIRRRQPRDDGGGDVGDTPISCPESPPQDGPDEPDDSFRIHTSHGDFDFDRLAVDLLEKFNSLRLEPAAEPPEGWLSINSFAEMNSAAAITVYKILERLGMNDLSTFRFFSVNALGLSPEQQTRILKEPEFALRPSDEIMSISGFAEKVGVTPKLIESLIEKLGLKLEKYQFARTFTTGLNPEQQELLRSQPQVSLEIAPEGYISGSTLRKNLKIGVKVMEKAIESLEIEVKEYKFGPKRGYGFSPEHVEQIEHYVKDTRAKPAPPEIMSVPAFAKSVRVAPSTLHKIIGRLNLDLPFYRFGAKTAQGLDEETMQLINSQPEVSTPLCPDGWVTVNSFAEKENYRVEKVYEACNALGLDLSSYKFKSGIHRSLSPQQQLDLKKALN